MSDSKIVAIDERVIGIDSYLHEEIVVRTREFIEEMRQKGFAINISFSVSDGHKITYYPLLALPTNTI